jgi:phage tail sheath protein FI
MHGIKTNVLTTGTRPIAQVATAIIGMVCTAGATAGAATDALNAAFPLDEVTLVTDVRAAAARAGTTGTLKATLEAIADQASATVLVVRKAVIVDAEDQEAAVLEGVQTLLTAEVVTGFKPRILGAPGLDSQAVTAELVTVAQKLRGMVYAQVNAAALADVADYAENFGDKELMLLWPNFTGGFAGDAVARALGLRAQIDETQGWHKTLSNVPVGGVTGVTVPVYFDIQDPSTDAQLLNDVNVTALVRSNGFRFWGNRTLSTEPLWSFESAVRTSQVMQDKIAEGLRWAIDKPLTKGLITDVLETINADIRGMVARGEIIGGSAWFDPALNSAEDLGAGKLTIDYDFTPAAPLEGLTLNQRLTDRYYADFAQQLAA